MFDELKAYALGLGDDVSGNELKVYYAFRKIRNFCTIQVQKTKILVNLKLNPDEFALSGELRDIRDKGHLGCGEMQFILRDKTRADAARELIFKAYENS